MLRAPGFGVEVERKELGDEHHEDDGGVAETEPQDRQRNPGNARDRIERPDHRIDEFAHGTRMRPTRRPERNRERRGNREAR